MLFDSNEKNNEIYQPFKFTQGVSIGSPLPDRREKARAKIRSVP